MEDGDGATTLMLKSPVDPVTIPSNSSTNPPKEHCETKYEEDDSFRDEKESNSSSISRDSDSSCSDIVNGILELSKDKESSEQDHKPDRENKGASNESLDMLIREESKNEVLEESTEDDSKDEVLGKDDSIESPAEDFHSDLEDNTETIEDNLKSNNIIERNDTSNNQEDPDFKVPKAELPQNSHEECEVIEKGNSELNDHISPELKNTEEVGVTEESKDQPKDSESEDTKVKDDKCSILEDNTSCSLLNELGNNPCESGDKKMQLNEDEEQTVSEDSKAKLLEDESIETTDASLEMDITDPEIPEESKDKLAAIELTNEISQKQITEDESNKIMEESKEESCDQSDNLVNQDTEVKLELLENSEPMECESVAEQSSEVQINNLETDTSLTEEKSENEVNFNDSKEQKNDDTQDLSDHTSKSDVSMVEENMCNEEAKRVLNISLDVSNNVTEVDEHNGEQLMTNNDIQETPSPKETRKRKLSTAHTSPQEELSSPEGNVEYKGFKKRILAQASQAASSSDHENDRLDSNCASSTSSILMSHQALPQSSTQQTEYAQYLGLQPTVKFKCYKCGESGFPSMLTLQEHQAVCLKSLKKEHLGSQSTQVPSDSSPSTNIRVTRKVYLCSSCGTYYENWNLFLHMREVHKRFICLFCLGMLSKAEKLASHLRVQHNVTENSYKTVEDFLAVFDKPCFLVCCTCERMFIESDNFHNHTCTEQGCSLCGLQGAHFPTCRRALSNSNVLNTSESAPDSQQNSQTTGTDKSGLVSKPVQGDKKIVSSKKSNEKPSTNQSKSKDIEPSEEDVIDASTFCQINLQEVSTKQKQITQSSKVTTKVKVIESNSNKSTQDTHVDQQIDRVTDSGRQEVDLETSATNTEKFEKIITSKKAVRGRGRVRRGLGRYSKNKSIGKKKGNLEIKDAPEEIETKKEDEIKSNYLPEEMEDLHPVSPEKEFDGSRSQSPDSDRLQINTQESEGDNQEAAFTESSSIAVSSESIKNEVKITEIELDKADPEKFPEKQMSENAPDVDSRPDDSVIQKSSKDPEIKEDLHEERDQAMAVEVDSDSETSDSVAGSRGTDDDSSSSSEATSEEQEKEKIVQNEKSDVEATDDSDGDNADSDKMSLVVDENRSADEAEVSKEDYKTDESKKIYSDSEDAEDSKTTRSEVKTEDDSKIDVSVTESKIDDNIQIAGEEVPILELTLEETVDAMTTTSLVKECVKVSCSSCVFCNHAKKIAVNGKQLVLHLLAEHRFEPVVCSDTGDLTPADGFIDKLKASVSELQDAYFNTETYDSTDKSFTKPYDRTYECFHCIFITTLHKELYVHNRKMHQKTILLCIMCKSNFYSYSELLCHLCPGIYVPDSNITFRCCICSVDGLPSAFRLMVHLRKRHHACDVCLETTGDQQRLSNHVWKHKLHHLCYRCGIAYRNKPDITKHLFWKHGTESVLCKKCLQKKWPHVYHFCIPPTAFNCEECNLSFTRAVALKVHKRLHAGDTPYNCDKCNEKFISKKLLSRHQLKHIQPSVESSISVDKISHHSSEERHIGDEAKSYTETNNESLEKGGAVVIATELGSKLESQGENQNLDRNKAACEDSLEKKTKVVDVYDLPPLNLSSDSDDSDDNEGDKKVQISQKEKEGETDKLPVAADVNGNPENDIQPMEEESTPVPLPVDGIWDNFKNYKANLEKRENQQSDTTSSSNINPVGKLPYPYCNMLPSEAMDIVLSDHDYCISENASTSKINAEVTGNEGNTTDKLVEIGDRQVTENADALDEEKNSSDHNYCYNDEISPVQELGKEKETLSGLSSANSGNNTLNNKNGSGVSATSVLNDSSSSINPNTSNSAVSSVSKKKPKTPKKKQKRSGSSSSSDSSTNSDSSSCSCGTNCSCSSSSSSSSGSSSSASSDSDSSTSEGRRRQAAKREKRKEKTKKKIEEVKKELPSQLETNVTTLVNGIQEKPDRIQPVHIVAEQEGEVPIHESDLETDETETDEDFYDQYPQRQANKLFAEKRNRLLLLAAVAPVNNGTMTQPSEELPETQEEDTLPKKKIKSKRRKKSHQQIVATAKPVENKLKLNIPPSYYEKQTSFSNVSQPISPVPLAASHRIMEHVTPTVSLANTGSGSETESKRLSKRKRVPKRFYGDTSDEDTDPAPAPVPHPLKWRKVAQNVVSSPAPTPPPAPEPARIIAPAQRSEEEDDDSESEVEAKQSSSDSSDSESDKDEQSDADSDSDAPAVAQTETNSTGDSSQQKSENLYCYCQCPYDEVSEMIACDGKDCQIEWFHFECVGIMVPPKGKWFCPDCRKKIPSRNIE